MISKLIFPLAIVVMLSVGAHSRAESISEAVKYALTTNPEILSREANMKATAFEFRQLSEEFLPRVEVFSDFGQQRIDDPSSLSAAENDVTKTRREIGIRASYVLFDGFRRANLVYATAAQVDASIYNVLDGGEVLALNAVESYIDVYRHQALLFAARRNVDRHVEIGERVRALVRAGRLPFSDELTINDRIGAAEIAALEVERALQNAISRYERVIGRKPSGNMAFTRVDLPSSQSKFREVALKSSYRVRRAQALLDRSTYEDDIALSDIYPTISLDAGASYGENQGGNYGERDDVFVGVTLNWTLYRGGRKAERNALAQRTYQAAYERDTVVREVAELVSRTWTSLQVNRELTRRLQRQLSVNAALVDVYNEEFDAAKRTLLDLLQVERARFNVEFEKISADAGFIFSKYRVQAAQSRLVEHFGIKAADFALDPSFQRHALQAPTSVFNVAIEPLE